MSLKDKNSLDQLEKLAYDQINNILQTVDLDQRLKSWNICLSRMTELNINLNPAIWLILLEDNIIGPTFEDRYAHIKTMVNILPKRNGYPVRSNYNTFQKHIYVNGEWELVKFGGMPKSDPYDDAMSIVK